MVLARGFDVAGIRNGYIGLIAGDFLPLGLREVGGIMQNGGTILGTIRCEEMRIELGCDSALSVLRAQNVAALIVIGGNGTHTGAQELARRGARFSSKSWAGTVGILH